MGYGNAKISVIDLNRIEIEKTMSGYLTAEIVLL
jgi:hypothetical protein